jgi:ribosomal protein S5
MYAAPFPALHFCNTLLMAPVHGIFDGRLVHDVKAKEGATTVQLFAARKGKGIVAGSKVKAVLRAVGLKDCIAKVRGGLASITHAAA